MSATPKELEYLQTLNPIAVFFAAFIPNYILFCGMPAIGGGTFSNLFDLGFFFLIAFIISLLHIIFAGFPLIYLASKRSKITLGKMVFVGGLAGSIPLFLINLIFFSHSKSALPDIASGFFVTFTYGSLSGLIYWYSLMLVNKIKAKSTSPSNN